MSWERDAVRDYKVRDAAIRVSGIVALVPPLLALGFYAMMLFVILTRRGETLLSPSEFFERWHQLNTYIGDMLWTPPWRWVAFIPICGLIAWLHLEKKEEEARARVERVVRYVASDRLDKTEKAFERTAYSNVVRMERHRRDQQETTSKHLEVA